MDITEVRIKLMDDPHDRLQAFCSVTFNSCFVIRDLKIIQGAKGSFVAMPSRKLTDRCPRCHGKNHLRAQFCNQCGAKLDEERATKDNEGRAKLYADIAHPINCDCRELIQSRVIEEFEVELVRSKEPGYVCTYDDYGEEHYATLKEPYDEGLDEASRTPAARVSRNGDISSGHEGHHRIEPAQEQPGAPHHRVGSTSQREHATANHIADSDDEFGAGL